MCMSSLTVLEHSRLHSTPGVRRDILPGQHCDGSLLSQVLNDGHVPRGDMLGRSKGAKAQRRSETVLAKRSRRG